MLNETFSPYRLEKNIVELCITEFSDSIDVGIQNMEEVINYTEKSWKQKLEEESTFIRVPNYERQSHLGYSSGRESCFWFSKTWQALRKIACL